MISYFKNQENLQFRISIILQFYSKLSNLENYKKNIRESEKSKN